MADGRRLLLKKPGREHQTEVIASEQGSMNIMLWGIHVDIAVEQPKTECVTNGKTLNQAAFGENRMVPSPLSTAGMKYGGSLEITFRPPKLEYPATSTPCKQSVHDDSLV